jgi:DNA recombination protein RmuC
MMSTLLAIAALIIGFLVAFVWQQNRFKNAQKEASDKLSETSKALEIAQYELSRLKEEKQFAAAELDNLRTQELKLTGELNQLLSQNKNLSERIEREQGELEKREEQLRVQFENLANEILEKKSEKFVLQNKENLGELLLPFRERIVEFQKRVEETNVQGEKRGAALVEQIRSLKELNQQITQEAKSLTQALRGDSKAQGNWGELQLENILSKAGLEKDIHYQKEKNLKTEEGQNQRLDYILNLPDGKHLILDSKVSLSAYSRYFDSEDETEQQLALKEHVNSMHNHIKDLGNRNYQNLYGISAPDYVLMFVANEPALTAALKEDNQLYEKALEKNVALVTTATLLATLRTISYIWKQDQQNKNADEIARQAAGLYDKFVGFTEDLIKLGNQMGTAQKTYKEAMNKLSEGTGNLVRRTENLRKLGTNPTKHIEPKLLDRSED